MASDGETSSIKDQFNILFGIEGLKLPKVVTRWRKVVRRSDGHLQRGRRRWVEVVLRPDVGAAVARAAGHDRGRGHGWKKCF